MTQTLLFELMFQYPANKINILDH